MMIQSRKLGNELVIKSPETRTTIQGVGCLLTEVGTSGGLKVVGILGRFTIRCVSSTPNCPLCQVSFSFICQGSRGFGEKVNLNLEKLIKSSYLCPGFPIQKLFLRLWKLPQNFRKNPSVKSMPLRLEIQKSPPVSKSFLQKHWKMKRLIPLAEEMKRLKIRQIH